MVHASVVTSSHCYAISTSPFAAFVPRCCALLRKCCMYTNTSRYELCWVAGLRVHIMVLSLAALRYVLHFRSSMALHAHRRSHHRVEEERASEHFFSAHLDSNVVFNTTIFLLPPPRPFVPVSLPLHRQDIFIHYARTTYLHVVDVARCIE